MQSLATPIFYINLVTAFAHASSSQNEEADAAQCELEPATEPVFFKASHF